MLQTVFNMPVEDYVENWETDRVSTSPHKRLHRLHTEKGVTENFGRTIGP